MFAPMDWLLLRGLSREQRHWGAFPEVFRAAAPGARIHLLDLPGTGTEAGRASPTSIRAITDDVRVRFQALRRRESLPGPFGLFGISLGGMVAMRWGADHPDDFARVVLANTSASDVGRLWDRLSPSALATMLRVAAMRDPVARERLVLAMVSRRRDDHPALAERWAEIQRSSPVTLANVARQLAAATLFRAPPRLSLPVLVLAGARDTLANPACARALAARFGAPLEIHPDAGHELAIDAPEWVAERVAAWAGGVPVAAASIHGR